MPPLARSHAKCLANVLSCGSKLLLFSLIKLVQVIVGLGCPIVVMASQPRLSLRAHWRTLHDVQNAPARSVSAVSSLQLNSL